MDSRYQRQLLLPEIGEEGQRKIRKARVLLVGVGGLGSPIALYLTGAGIGTLGIVDDDVVTLTNLHRQVIYGESQIGLSKIQEAEKRLHDLNKEVEVRTYPFRFTRENALSLVSDYDIVIDGCDNFETRFVIDDTCAQATTPYIYGAICGFEGQVSVFHAGNPPHSYRELFPDEKATLQMPHPGKQVVGMTPAVVGSVMACQTLQLICGFGNLLVGKLWTINLCTMQSVTLSF